VTSRGRVIVVGAANIDMVLELATLPAAGETAVARGEDRSVGGKGANAARAARRIGADAHLIAAVGNDASGEEIVTQLTLRGVSVTSVQRLEGASGLAVVAVGSDAENMVLVAPRANARLTPEHVVRWIEDLGSPGDSVLVSCEVPLVSIQAAVDAGRQCGARVILNPAPAQRGLLAAARGAILTPNEHEACALADTTTWNDALVRLHNEVGAPVVATRGARGATVIAEGRRQDVPAPPVTAVDTTGAGDVFNGVLAGELAMGTALDDAAVSAVAAASASVKSLGAGLPTHRSCQEARRSSPMSE